MIDFSELYPGTYVYIIDDETNQILGYKQVRFVYQDSKGCVKFEGQSPTDKITLCKNLKAIPLNDEIMDYLFDLNGLDVIRALEEIVENTFTSLLSYYICVYKTSLKFKIEDIIRFANNP